jgi:nitrate reductase NapAB chaperone NapD
MKTASLLVNARADRAGAVRARVASLHGVKVRGFAPEGHLLVTIEREDDRAIAATIALLEEQDDVLGTMRIGEADEAHGTGG